MHIEIEKGLLREIHGRSLVKKYLIKKESMEKILIATSLQIVANVLKSDSARLVICMFH